MGQDTYQTPDYTPVSPLTRTRSVKSRGLEGTTGCCSQYTADDHFESSVCIVSVDFAMFRSRLLLMRYLNPHSYKCHAHTHSQHNTLDTSGMSI